MPIGLYIHVPFCHKKCRYCDFISYPYEPAKAALYTAALDTEMALHAENLRPEHREIASVYVGGGTPTTLEGEQLAGILESCRRYFNVAGDAEITVECNPGTAAPGKLETIRKAGFNRISIGVQAYQQEMLSKLGRIHGWPEVVAAVGNSRQAGFTNLSLDLIFGIPGQTMKHWRETLARTLELGPQHVSAYNLKIEPDTPLHRDVETGYVLPCDEELELEMFWYGIEFLSGAGYAQYEISNFAQPGREARHNLIYWHNREYLGLGPAAHSMLNCHRFNNIESVESYIRRLQRRESVIQVMTHITTEEQMAETVFLGLRLMEGLDLNEFAGRFGQPLAEVYGCQLTRLLDLGLVEIEEDRLKLTEKGLPLANEVFAEFV